MRVNTNQCISFLFLSKSVIQSYAISINLQKPTSSLIQDIKVYDNVFSPTACEALHELTLDHFDRCQSSITNRFPATSSHPNTAPKMTPLEKTIHNLLLELGDESTSFIEYWSRSEHMNIDAHCDIDERELENEGMLRYPEWSHVLYLQVDDIGPTCVFDREGGWGDRRPSEESDDNGGEREDGTTMTQLVTVPAVTGRLLRFPGRLLHAVPKPVHRWLLSDDEERNIKVKDDDYEWDDEWCDDEDDDVVRSVLLFNSWSDRPPRDVLPDKIINAIPDGIEIDPADWEAYIAREQATTFQQWEEEYGPNAELLQCCPRSSWLTRKLSNRRIVEGGDDLIRVGLMGKKDRRLFERSCVHLKGSKDGLRVALNEKDNISLLSCHG